jgi:hypothetical protein
MPDIWKQGCSGDEDRAFPRFLHREETGHNATGRAATEPPPLPRQTMLDTLLGRLWAHWHQLSPIIPHRVAGLAVALVVVVPAAAALVADRGWRQADPPQIKSTVEAHDEIAQALQIVEVFEARLGYAGNLASVQQEKTATLPPETSNLNQLADAASPLRQAAVVPDSVGLLILRGLPEGVTFTTGGPAGDGAWAMPPGSPDHPVTVLGGGLDTPVTSDVDMISHAGLVLGSFRLELHKPVEAVAALVAADPEVTAVEAAGLQAPKTVTETTDAAAKPVKRRRHGHAQANAGARSKIAQADGGQKKRVRRTRDQARDQLKSKPSDAAEAGEQTKDAVANTGGDEKQPGLFTKFFAWLKSGQNSDTKPPTEDEAATRMGLSSRP